jgi:hypothetical protein
MSVRQKVYDGLVGTPALLSLLAEGAAGVRAGGSLEGRIDQRPFVIYRIQEMFAALRGDDSHVVTHTNVEIWVYDEPGTFTRIEAALAVIMGLMPNIVGLKAEFRGVSGELPDDDQKAVTKNVVYACWDRTS